MTNESITAPQGFLAAGVKSGIKVSGKPDVALLVCPTGATAAAVFTTNTITSAAVQVSREHVTSRTTYAVVVNSGNANACTGKIGIANARKMCAATAKSLGSVRNLRLAPKEVLVASTGIIGEQLPIDKAVAGIEKAGAELSDSSEAGMAFTAAIMTTDTKPKCAVRTLRLSGKTVTIAGTVKGAGMIGPNMATTLLFITTDAAISKPLLGAALRDAVGNSLNKLTVDGHQSTNDTGIILASGLAGNPPIVGRASPLVSRAGTHDLRKFTDALLDLCTDLARQMALDAEGATRMFKVVVKRAATQAQAAKAARAVADYPLVKCAVHGGDPNWGRIICAVGSCGVKLDPAKLSCKLDKLYVFKNGAPARFDAERASAIVSQTEHTITVDLGTGKASDFCYGCELSAGYVSINADYHT
ncbi:MAG: bifunctional glutamate N-acetyltransferase/amino-acid acetyltransferase ArgJ [Sedimentisphaerales bacterium]|nr:bifunctional glutamate N-acetyltransferase/amino-acid acetyltransferase ArgJ [Sedimentisphaerales bacterium]